MNNRRSLHDLTQPHPEMVSIAEDDDPRIVSMMKLLKAPGLTPSSGPTAIDSPSPRGHPIPDDVAEALRALGYLDAEIEEGIESEDEN